MFFKKHNDPTKAGRMDAALSNLFFFLPLVTDKSGEVNKYINNVSTRPVDITQAAFKQWIDPDEKFDPLRLDLFGAKRSFSLKHMARISISI